jgi:hypothetical protein
LALVAAIDARRRPVGRRFLPLILAVVVVGLLLPGPTIGKTTVTPFTASRVLLSAGHNSLPLVTVVKSGLMKVPGATLFRSAGTVAFGARGVAGSTRTLAACAFGVCNDSFRGASTGRLVAGHYAAWLELTLTQPPRTGTAFGFAVEFAVETGAGWFAVTAYFSTGTSTAATGQTVHVDVLIDLGTTVLPTLRFTGETLALCASRAACP